MKIQPIDLVRGDIELPMLPVVFQRFMAKLDDPAARADDFSEIISTDPSLTTRLLKIVNSAYYSFSATITDVSHAITIIGLAELRDMVMAVSVVEFFDDLPNELVSMQVFWTHSVFTGLLAKELQLQPKLKTHQSMFTAGVVHDIGSLVFYNRLPELARSVLELAERQSKPTFLIEREKLGFDHGDIGGELVQHWGLPEFFFETVKSHHKPENAGQFDQETLLLAVANSIASAVDQENPVEEIQQDIKALYSVELTETELQLAIDNAQEKLDSVMSGLFSA